VRRAGGAESGLESMTFCGVPGRAARPALIWSDEEASARFIYEYDLNIPWRHEVRIEDRVEPEARKTYPVCIGGGGACPPEDCGGPESFMAEASTRPVPSQAARQLPEQSTTLRVKSSSTGGACLRRALNVPD
jgi:hypothetical protein